MTTTNPHMLPANVRDEFGIPVTETIAAMKSGDLTVINPAVGFLRRRDVLAWIATR